MNYKLQWACALALSAALLGCSAPSKSMHSYREEQSYAMGRPASAKYAPAAKSLNQNDDWNSQNAIDNEVANSPITQAPKVKRATLYEGFLTQSVRESGPHLDRLDSIVQSVGGVTLRRGNNDGYYKVPADSFASTFTRLEQMAQVLDRSLQSADLSRQVQEVELRLRLLRSQFAKLKELYAKAVKPELKMRLLDQIEATSRSIAEFEESQKNLADLVAYSRIQVTLQEPTSLGATARPALDAFSWIRKLSPTKRNYWNWFKLAYPVPSGFVDLKDVPIWKVTSSGGTVGWAHKIPNQPRGNGDFWVKALQADLAARFKTVVVDTLGGFARLRCQSYDHEPFSYWIGLELKSTTTGTLHISEIYFPTPAQTQTHQAAWEKAWKQVQP